MNIRKSTMVAMAKNEMRQGDLAEKMGVAQNTLSQILIKNNPNSTTIERLAAAFGLPVSEFVALGED